MKQLCHCVCQRAKLRKHNVFFHIVVSGCYKTVAPIDQKIMLKEIGHKYGKRSHIQLLEYATGFFRAFQIFHEKSNLGFLDLIFSLSGHISAT